MSATYPCKDKLQFGDISQSRRERVAGQCVLLLSAGKCRIRPTAKDVSSKRVQVTLNVQPHTNLPKHAVTVAQPPSTTSPGGTAVQCDVILWSLS